jgi:hypothetical protein
VAWRKSSVLVFGKFIDQKFGENNSATTRRPFLLIGFSKAKFEKALLSAKALSKAFST